MAIALRGSANHITGASGNGGDVTLTFDTGTPPLENDIVVVFGGHGTDVTTLTAPGSGYTQIGIHTGSAPIFGMWYKRMGATPDLSVVCSGGGDAQDAVCYGCYVLSGVDTTTAEDATATTAGPTASTNPDPASITTANTDAWVIAVTGSDVRDTSPGTISGYSNQLNTNRNDTNDITIAGATFENPEADAEDPGAWSTWSSGTWYAITAAFRAQAAGNHIALPGVGSIALAGQVPLKAEGLIEFPGIGSLTLAGQVPESHQDYPAQPGAGSLTLAGQVPKELHGPGLLLCGFEPTISIDAVSANITEEPGVGSLSLAGQTPEVIIGHVGLPANGSLTLAGQVPVVSRLTQQPLGSLSLTGNAPVAVVNHIVSPANGTLTLAPQTPTVEITHIRVPAAGTLTLAGQVPVEAAITHIRGPPAGSLSLTGLVPTVSVGAGVIAEPGVGSLTLSGQVPSAEITHIRVPAAGSLSLTSFAPKIIVGPGLKLIGFPPTAVLSGDLVVQPGVGSLTLAPQQPTAFLSNIIVQPGAGSLSLTGQIPFADIGASHVIQVPVGSLTLTTFDTTFINSGDNKLILTGFAPIAVIGNPEQPGTGTLTLTGFTPFPQITLNPLVVNPSPGSLSLSPQQPAIFRDLTAEPGAGSLTLTGLAPGISVSATNVVFPGQAALALNGQVPTVVIDTVDAPQHVSKPGVASLTLSANAPFPIGTDPVALKALPEIGKLILAGQQPSAEQVHFKEVPIGSLTLQGWGPQVVPSDFRKGRIRKGKKPKRYVVEIDNQLFEVESAQAAKDLLLQVRELAQEQAKTQPVSQPKISVRTIGGAPTKSKVIQTAVRDTKKAIRLINQRANERIRQDQEISRLLNLKLRDEDEEEAILALLL